ncbi:MAG: DUF3300 domain-containing protein [Gemmatimonadaceae bacterium]
MMRRSVVRSVLGSALFLSPLAPSLVANAQNPTVAVTGLDGQARFTAEQLDNLTGPIALYPDALLAQVLVAATFPDQIQDAATFVRANGTDGIDNQAWDISVKAVAHYPSALNTMADKIDWTTALGKAYASQSSEVMTSVQRLRSMAAAQGNLKTTEQQQVVQENGVYEIAPTQTRIIYVPVYDPYIIYSQPIFSVGFRSSYWSFGVGFPIGAWLSYDCDWGLRRVYYNGWAPVYYGYAGGWRERARPYVRVTDIYISPRYRDVYVNHAIINRYVDYRNVDRYGSVHRGQQFASRPDNRHFDNDDRRGPQGNPPRGGDNRTGQARGDGAANDHAQSGNNNGNNGSRGGYPNNSGNNNGGRNGGVNNGGNNNGNDNGGRNGGANNNGNDNGGRNGGANNGGNNRVPPQNRRNEPGRAQNGPDITAPTRTPPTTQQGTTPPASNGQIVVPARTGDQGHVMSDPRYRNAEPRRAQPAQQPPPQQQAQPPVQQQQQVVAPPREARHEQQQQVRVQPTQVQQQAPPKQQPAPPAKARSDDKDKGRGGDDKGRGGDDRRGRSRG